ncbi:MAG: Glu/Leu/Phe/Val dehydrogenase dimerization domain-containing protein [Acidobacteriota bacterium]
MSAPPDVWTRYRAFLCTPPHRVVSWTDAETGARGWLVINSLRGGAAAGGTRMRAGLTLEELHYLAKTMELKFVFSGPAIGGAKSGIDFDPRDPRKPDVLARWFRQAAPLIRVCYGTGADLNVDEARELIPQCRAAGLRHPQEGVLRGHLRAAPEAFERVVQALETGLLAPLPDGIGVRGLRLTVSDVAAGYGLARAVACFYARGGLDLEGARAVIEGFGTVGASAALQLARAGARIVAIADAEKTLVEPAGLGAAEVEDLIARRTGPGRRLPPDPRCVGGAERARLRSPTADIFVAAALSNSIDRERLAWLEAVGVSVVACGANYPFRESQVGATEIQQEADRRFSIIPDLIGSAGTACTYSYLITDGAIPDPAAILAAVDARIVAAMDEVLDRNRGAAQGLLEAALGAALERI